MVARNIAVLNPTAHPKVKSIPGAPRIQGLDGKVVGFLWNKKPNANILLEGIRDYILEHSGASGADWQQKKGLAEPASDEVVKDLVDKTDFVVNALGD